MGLWHRRSYVPEEKRLSREAVVTLVMQGLFLFGSTMSGTFMNLYLWRLTNSLWISGLFNIVTYAFTAVGFVVGGKLAKRKGLLTVYRLGIAFIALYYLVVVLTRESVAPYYALFGACLGFAGGLYWIGYWSITYVVSHDGNRLRFIGLASLTSTIATLAAPLTSAAIFGVADGLAGYAIVFGAAFVVFVLAALTSTRIRLAPVRRKTYYLRHMIPLMRTNADWRKAVLGNTLLGFKQGALLFLPTLLVYQVMQEENKVGYFNAALSLLSIAASYLFSRYATERGARTYLLVTVTLYVAAAGSLVFGVTLSSVVAFMLVHTVCNPVKAGAFDGYYYRLIGSMPLKGELRVETMVIREACWNTGRIAFVLLLVVFVNDLRAAGLAWFVLLTMASQYALVALLDKPKR
ncbi:MFS transporter [Paenibacillus flagellatus]|uniref:MFS transporter n=1 Tax=Paenibacillus flagellatus TaxID=2211139 RepID=A0A2V5KAB8_9BACL|nr:MFS transporter [Paenibacillus flagellatus]PYI56388.1 MFS transporter [Paenibacillus flagellatus]